MILITGGTGYIGSHACVALVETGFDVLLLDNLANSEASGVDRLEAIYGTRPGSVDGDNRDGVQLIRTFESSNGRGVPLDVGARRHGDVAESWADTSLATRSLGWSAGRSLDDMCTDSWRWQPESMERRA